MYYKSSEIQPNTNPKTLKLIVSTESILIFY